MDIKKSYFGTLNDGKEVSLFTLDNGKMKVCVSDFGCTITAVLLPGKAGSYTDVVLGHSNLDGYIRDNVSQGALVGRFANRIGKGEFTLEGVKYLLDQNDNGNCLHGGFDRYEKTLWDSQTFCNDRECGVVFTRTSPDGEQGFPGNVKFTVTYSLNLDNEITLDYKGTTDKATPVNLTNHTYFNLKGTGLITDQKLTINSDKILEVNENLIPTGKFVNVAGTPFDFNKGKLIGQDIEKVMPGYDHCYVTKADVNEASLVEFATLEDPSTGRRLKMKTDQAGVQVYTSNFLKDNPGKKGVIYKNHEAICLESERFPDAVNHPDFPSCILEPGKEYHSVTVYGFEWQ